MQVSAIRIEFDDAKEQIRCDATVDLYANNDFKVSSITFSTNSWSDNTKIKVEDLNAIFLSGELRKILTLACTLKINSLQKLLPQEINNG